MEGESHDQAAAVLDVVRVFFTEERPPLEDMLGGALLEWSRLRGEPPWSERFTTVRALESAEIAELGATHAVVKARATSTSSPVRGTRRHEWRFDGTVVLEQVRGRWRIVDYVDADGRRLDGLAVGVLAEQVNGGVTVRVLGASLGDRAFECVVEVANATAADVVVEHGYFRREAAKGWGTFYVGEPAPVAPGATATVLLNTGARMPLGTERFGLALDVRSAHGRLPFLLEVPLSVPDAVSPQPPPARLPARRWTKRRWWAYCAVFCAVCLWWFGWVGLVAPLFIGGVLYERARLQGSLPARAYRFRYVLDVLVVAAAFLILWLTPAYQAAVPMLVGVAVYLPLRYVAHQGPGLAFLLAASVAAGWFFWLGSENGPLSPCRIADGRPSAAADTFARATLSGDDAAARRLATDGLRPELGNGTPTLPAAEVDPVVRARSPLPDERADLCLTRDGDEPAACYRYPLSEGGLPLQMMAVVVCDGRDWRVDGWYAF